MSTFRPDWFSPPGSSIADILLEKRIDRIEFAGALGVKATDIDALICGDLEIDSALAHRIAATLGSTSRFWLARETSYRRELRRSKQATSVAEVDAWLQSMPVRDMIRFGWLCANADLSSCLDFFGVADIRQWRARYEEQIVRVAFRSSASYDTNPSAVAAWLRRGEIAAFDINCDSWNREGFHNSLQEIRSLTREKDPTRFFPTLRDICASYGVAVVVARTPAGCPASGAARFIGSQRALIQLSDRYKTDDQFWFTFFHEAAHLICHRDKVLWLEGVGAIADKTEEEANIFARNVLLSIQQQSELMTLSLTYKSTIRFARHAGVSPGIIAGQLQHAKRAGFDRLNKAKRSLEWKDILL
jgi:plasmid maintenance system antidote protein VapI